MSALAYVKAHLLRRLNEDERGTTLTELIVGMAIMAVFMTMFTGATLLMSNTVNKVQAISTSAAQINAAFLKLDKSVRYATGISPVGRSATTNDYHVEFNMISPSGAAQCVQLRVDGTTLQQRTWTPSSDGTTYSNLSGWAALASNVQTANPFVVPTDTSSPYQQLQMTLKTSSGTITSGSTQSSMTFTAVNSDSQSTVPVCQQVSVDATT